MKYKFTLSDRVKGMTEWNLEHYHEYKTSLEQYKNDMVPSIISKYPYKQNGVDEAGIDPDLIRSSWTSRPTEIHAMQIATSPYILHTERCISAVEKALSLCDDTDKKLIDLVYWKQSHTVVGAGLKVNLCKTAAYGRINNILCIIALELGYVSI